MRRLCTGWRRGFDWRQRPRAGCGSGAGRAARRRDNADIHCRTMTRGHWHKHGRTGTYTETQTSGPQSTPPIQLRAVSGSFHPLQYSKTRLALQLGRACAEDQFSYPLPPNDMTEPRRDRLCASVGEDTARPKRRGAVTDRTNSNGERDSRTPGTQVFTPTECYRRTAVSEGTKRRGLGAAEREPTRDRGRRDREIVGADSGAVVEDRHNTGDSTVPTTSDCSTQRTAASLSVHTSPDGYTTARAPG